MNRWAKPAGRPPSAASSEQPAARAALRVVLVYAGFASLWILLSDKAVAWLFDDPATLTFVSMIKGWTFVAVTAALLFGLIHRLLKEAWTASTALIEAQKERLRASQLLDNIANSSPDAIFAKDLEGRYILFNRETARIFGKNAETALGCDDRKLFPGQAEMIRANDQKVIVENRVNTYEELVFTADGERTYLSIKGPLRDVENNVIGMFGIARDITERKQAETAIVRLNAELEERVRQRTADLESANRTLVHAKDAAESANRAKSAFLSNMSHELRTPLNAILGFAHLLERDSGQSEASRKKLETIHRAGQHLLLLINGVLEISRIEAGRVAIQHASFDLVELLTGVEEMIRVRAEGKDLDFRVVHAPDLPRYVEGDGAHLKQVLINLLGNAVKYTDQGSVQLDVIRRNGEVVFAVGDTGHGIVEEDQKHIFQAFYQTEGGIAKGEGTGLGLAISHEYARLMSGRLEVSSRLGAGSVFTLRVPLPPAAAPSTVTASAGGRVIGLDAAPENVRMLVVDDMADNRELVRQLLEVVGFEVRMAENGQQAVDAYSDWHPALIWMDMRMPVMDGYEATRRIRALPGGRAVKIVALTATAFEEDREEILAAGCDDLVRKPFDEERLFAVIAQLIGVRYRYIELAGPESLSPRAEPDLAVLSAPMRKELCAAAEALDVDLARMILARMQAEYPALAAQLASLVEAFRFDRIADLCRSGVRGGDGV